MEDKDVLIIGVILAIVIYLVSPIPYCKTCKENLSDAEVNYSSENVEDMIEEFPTVYAMNVVGSSMLPTIEEGDRCLCVVEDEYEIGDIVSYVTEWKQEGNYILVIHRIIGIGDDGTIYTKGDNNDFVDTPITKEDILCAVPDVPRYLTYIS